MRFAQLGSNVGKPALGGGYIWFTSRREPYYHKLQYSKTPKYDPMAALLGAGVGAFAVYLSLGTFGTSGADLSDLTISVWYGLLFVVTLRLGWRVFLTNLAGGWGVVQIGWFSGLQLVALVVSFFGVA